MRENQNKKKEVNELREKLSKKEAALKLKEKQEPKPIIAPPIKQQPKTVGNLPQKEEKIEAEPALIEPPKKVKKPVVKSMTRVSSLPRPPSRRADMDIALAIALQEEEYELNQQIFMFEMMEERDRHIRQTGQDHVDPDNMTYEELMELQEKVGKVKVGLSPAQFAKLKKEHYSPNTHKLNSCSICLNEFEEGQPIIKLKCLHLFDPECLKRWVDDNKSCPICKAEIAL